MIVLDYSHTLTGSTMWMVDRLSQMKAGGVKVLLSAGVSGDSGIQHSKTVLCDEYVIIGSCNWTTASRANQEIDVLVALNEVGLAAYDERLKYIMEHSRVFDDELVKAGRVNRSKRATAREHKSVPPAERYATAKRFSIARARSAGRSAKEQEDRLAA